MQKLLNYCNTPLLAALSLAAFMALAYASKPYGDDQGYTLAARNKLAEIATTPLPPHAAGWSVTKKREAFRELGW